MLVNTVAIVSSLFILPRVWVDIDWRRIAPLLLAAAPGAVLGTWLILLLNAAWLEVCIGISLLIGLASTVFFPQSQGARELPVVRLILGASAGAMSTAAGSGGPLVLIYASLAGWPFRVLRASVQPYYLGIAVFALTVKSVVDPGAFPALGVWGWGLVLGCLFASILFGNRIAGMLPSALARAAAYALSAVGALVTLFRGIFEVIASGV